MFEQKKKQRNSDKNFTKTIGFLRHQLKCKFCDSTERIKTTELVTFFLTFNFLFYCTLTYKSYNVSNIDDEPLYLITHLTFCLTLMMTTPPPPESPQIISRITTNYLVMTISNLVFGGSGELVGSGGAYLSIKMYQCYYCAQCLCVYVCFKIYDIVFLCSFFFFFWIL